MYIPRLFQRRSEDCFENSIEIVLTITYQGNN